jgi:hypothetical protein
MSWMKPSETRISDFLPLALVSPLSARSVTSSVVRSRVIAWKYTSAARAVTIGSSTVPARIVSAWLPPRDCWLVTP